MLTEGDQQLVFNQGSPGDIAFFIRCIQQKKEIILKEFPEQQEVRQYNAFLLPASPIILTDHQKSKSLKKQGKRKFMPGTEWLYLKIYSPRLGVGRLLLQLRPLLRKTYAYGKVKQWFFIRYEDHAPHIRIRLWVDPRDISEVLISFKNKMEDRIQQHVIREYQVDVYNRELERYAAGGMETTETVFYASSELVLNFIGHNRFSQVQNAYRFALYSVRKILQVFLPDADRQLIFTQQTYLQFQTEFGNQAVKVELDRKYRELSTAIQSTLAAEDPSLGSGSLKAGKFFVKTLCAAAARLSPVQEDYGTYLQSLIHMHLNRIFTDEPRKQEMITYYFLYKYLLSERGRKRQLQRK
jgi:thiopeptide-type bacteriocin biosynthesis protein